MVNGKVDTPMVGWSAPAIRNLVPEAIAQYRPNQPLVPIGVEHVAVLEAGRPVGVVVVGVLAHVDLRRGDQGPEEDHAVVGRQRVDGGRIRRQRELLRLWGFGCRPHPGTGDLAADMRTQPRAIIGMPDPAYLDTLVEHALSALGAPARA
jgi:hypothetical protein